MNPKISTLLILLSSVSMAQSSSDSAKEKRFHRIYKNSMEQPTSDDAWSKAGSGKAQSYEIQKGDTLWGISETLFGDPNFYPKIWSLNTDIFNPHEINPQHVVQFRMGSTDEPPTISMATADEAAKEANATVVSEKPAESTGLPPPKYENKPAAPLPESFPGWDNAAPSKVSFSIENRQKAPEHAQVILESFIHEGRVDSLGVVSEIETGGDSSAEEHFIYLKFHAKPTQTHYLIVADSESLKGLKNDIAARKLTVLAEVDISAVANRGENLYLAKATKLINAITVGSFVTVGAMETVSAEETSEMGHVAARIIGGAKDEHRQVYGDHEIIFISEGSGKGVAPGQMLEIFRRQTIRVPTTEHIENFRPIGRMKILKVTKEFATGIITHSTEAIHTGDATINAETPDLVVKDEAPPEPWEKPSE